MTPPYGATTRNIEQLFPDPLVHKELMVNSAAAGKQYLNTQQVTFPGTMTPLKESQNTIGLPTAFVPPDRNSYILSYNKNSVKTLHLKHVYM